MRVHQHPFMHDPGLAEGPPITDALVATAEANLGLKLPKAYIDALRTCNGGPLRRTRLPLGFQTTWGRHHVGMHDLFGIGYPGGTDSTDGTAWLAKEWDYPTPCVVISGGGRWATLLDYRTCGPTGTPSVVWVDTDVEVDGQPAEWTIAPDFAHLEAGLAFAPRRAQLALLGAFRQDEVVAALIRAGAVPPARDDYTGAQSVTVLGKDSREEGPALATVRPNRHRDGSGFVVPELTDCQWVIESTIVAEQLPDFLGALEGQAPGELVLLHQPSV